MCGKGRHVYYREKSGNLDKEYDVGECVCVDYQGTSSGGTLFATPAPARLSGECWVWPRASGSDRTFSKIRIGDDLKARYLDTGLVSGVAARQETCVAFG